MNTEEQKNLFKGKRSQTSTVQHRPISHSAREQKQNQTERLRGTVGKWEVSLFQCMQVFMGEERNRVMMTKTLIRKDMNQQGLTVRNISTTVIQKSSEICKLDYLLC